MVENSICPFILIWNCPIWHYPLCFHYSMCYPVFSIHTSLIWRPILETFSTMNSTCYFFICLVWFSTWRKFSCLSNFEKIQWSNKFLLIPPYRNFLIWKSRWPLLLMRPWTLNLDYRSPGSSSALNN
jgi:hypothetical protein